MTLISPYELILLVTFAKYLFSFIFLFSFFFIFILLSPGNTYAAKVFTENFDDGNADGWVVVNDPDRTPCVAPWHVNAEGMLGISINQGNCTTNIMPDDVLWNNLGNNYIFELDMKFVAGTDHNVAFRFTPSNPSNDWYGLHFQSPGDVVLERVNPGDYDTFVAGGYLNNKTYHLEIIVNGNNIKVFIDDVLVRDYTSATDRFPTGRVALRAGTGVDSVSETYFDNLVVTSLEEGLGVPYYSQNDPEWGGDEYDLASSWSGNPTIDRWGCALTSAAMVLRYHGVDQGPDGVTNEPGSLNNWLKTQIDGYLRGGAVNWLALTRFSRLANNLFGSTILDFRRGGSDTGLLDQDLNDANPVILETTRAGGAHFVVAKGKTNASYSILDPESQANTDLLAYGNSFRSTRRLLPTQTNLSALLITADKELGLNLSGEEELPLVDDGGGELSGEPYRLYQVNQPADGEYQLELTASASGWFNWEIYGYNQEANPTVKQEQVYLNSGETSVYQFNYQQGSGDLGEFHRQVDWQQLRQDVDAAFNQGWITQEKLANDLKKSLTKAEKAYNKSAQKGLKQLNSWEKLVNKSAKKGKITGEGKDFLLQELQYLRVSL